MIFDMTTDIQTRLYAKMNSRCGKGTLKSPVFLYSKRNRRKHFCHIGRIKVCAAFKSRVR